MATGGQYLRSFILFAHDFTVTSVSNVFQVPCVSSELYKLRIIYSRVQVLTFLFFFKI